VVDFSISGISLLNRTTLHYVDVQIMCIIYMNFVSLISESLCIIFSEDLCFYFIPSTGVVMALRVKLL